MTRFTLLFILSSAWVTAFAQSKYEQAIRLFEEADSIHYQEEEELERDKNQFRSARQKYETAKGIFLAIDSTYFGFRCDVQMLKCDYRTDELKLADAQSLIERLKADGVEDTLLGQAYYHEGAALKLLFRYEEAITSFKKSIPLFEHSHDRKALINTHWFLGTIYQQLREPHEKLDHYDKGALLLSGLPKSKFKVRTLFFLTLNSMRAFELKVDMKSYWDAYFFSRQILENNPDYFTNMEVARVYFVASEGLRHFGNYEKSYDYLLKSMSVHNNVIYRIDLGLTLSALGKSREAIDQYNIVLKSNVRKKIRSMALNNLGHEYLELTKIDSAIEYFKNALEINKEISSANGMAINLGNIGELHSRDGRYYLAQQYYREAISILPNYRPEIHRLLSENFYRQRKIDSATFYANSALFSSKGAIVWPSYGARPFDILLKNVNWLLAIHEQLASQDWIYSNQLVEICQNLLLYFDEFKYIHSSDNFTLNEETSFIYEQGIRHSLMVVAATDSLKYKEKAFQFSEWSKVHALERAKRTSEAKFLAGLPEDVIDRERSLKIDENYFRSQLSKFENVENPDSVRLSRYNRRLSEIQFSQDSLENVLRIEYPRYHQLRYQDATLSVKEVQDRLEPHQAFIEYYQGDTTSFVFTITKADYHVEPIRLDEDTLITTFRTYFEPETFEPEADTYADISHQIYQNYVAPALEKLDASITELIVVPDGKLSYIPFDILLAAPANHENTQGLPYLLRDYQIHYTYSASLYFNDFSTLSTKDQYLAFAPAYESMLTDTVAVNSLGNFRNQITPLAFNSTEVKHLANQFKGVGFLGETANERNFKENVEEYGVLHLAMHTIVDDEDPMNSKLVFSNSKDTLEDDQLHAFEIYNMEIPSQLTVLSACETGFGKLAKGEGALSLARAFSYAGSPSVVMSHWPVDDQTTAELMRYFYDYLAEGLPKSEALRKAKLDFLNNTHSARAHPFFWGSFVVMGDDSPVQLERRLVISSYWWLLLGFIVVGLTGLGYKRYRL